MEDNYNADRFIDELIDSVYWYLPKEYRQYEFNELDREEKLKIAFENISLEKFKSMFYMNQQLQNVFMVCLMNNG